MLGGFIFFSNFANIWGFYIYKQLFLTEYIGHCKDVLQERLRIPSRIGDAWCFNVYGKTIVYRFRFVYIQYVIHIIDWYVTFYTPRSEPQLEPWSMNMEHEHADSFPIFRFLCSFWGARNCCTASKEQRWPENGRFCRDTGRIFWGTAPMWTLYSRWIWFAGNIFWSMNNLTELQTWASCDVNVYTLPLWRNPCLFFFAVRFGHKIGGIPHEGVSSPFNK